MQEDLLKRYRVFTATISNVIFDKVYNANDFPQFHETLSLKCYANEPIHDSFKITLPIGDDKSKSLIALFKLHSIYELLDKEVQFIYFRKSLFGISVVGPMEKVFFIVFTPSHFGCAEEIKMPMRLSALNNFIADCTHSGRPYFITLPELEDKY